jgi:hypothetical protein
MSIVRLPAHARRFALHYAEMVAVMLAGMALLWVPTGLVLDAAGSGWSEVADDAPALYLLLMCATMTVPMVAWMRLRGHAWRPSLEMAGAMVAPTLLAIALVAAGTVASVHDVMVAEHVAMLVAMLAVMLARPDEYAHGHRHHRRVAAG